ncbi:hypothetical protein J1TS5_14690 [Paenibacillus macerans]|nr:hypothetical protein PbJCM17693_13790 [Paenibacillus macerans]GIP09299.1 hypothetical protein J1TS5_14690 [Paenibacillus macerans]
MSSFILSSTDFGLEPEFCVQILKNGLSQQSEVLQLMAGAKPVIFKKKAPRQGSRHRFNQVSFFAISFRLGG